ncbi:hypothetical protein QA808_18520 [Streptomyces sp. B21-089]|uniref:ParB/RepB/Spo0J family partition protein n=1 Tax=Streptomyces sp. B21-089 TaxID=3039412 RepID=UPI002FF048BC
MEHTLKIHPVADMFPMLTPDELLDLAESIKAEGQHKDIVLDDDGTILDGRNRLAACQIAGIQPHFTTYTGSNPARLIISNNVHRRHISKGQQAMITVMACSLSGHSLRDMAKLHSLSRSRLSAANVVLKHDPDLAEQVRNGTLSLDTAHNTVLESKAWTTALQKQHDRLREHAPDLLERITEGHITLEDAAATLDQRLETQRIRQYVIDTGRRAPRRRRHPPHWPSSSTRETSPGPRPTNAPRNSSFGDRTPSTEPGKPYTSSPRTGPPSSTSPPEPTPPTRETFSTASHPKPAPSQKP